MIASILYLLIFLYLIYFNGFFGLFNDPAISRKQYTLLFFVKALAVPVFIFVYTKLYGGIENFDTGKFYHDSRLINEYGREHPGFFVRLLLGLQDDNPGSADFENCLKNTVNWDNGIVKDYLYNDNRIVIRLHALLHFIAFNSYPAHALFNCFVSFTGIRLLYLSFKDWFTGKELALLLTMCFWPALWFYTGAALKEGIVLLVMGGTLYYLKKIFQNNYGPGSLFILAVFLFFSFLLKPYVLIFSALCFSLFFALSYSPKIKLKVIFFAACVGLSLLLVNICSLALKKRSLLSAALEQHSKFVGVSKGGVFISDAVKLIRVTDTAMIRELSPGKKLYTIRKNVPYMYWQRPELLRDTFRVAANTDTTSVYHLMYIIPEASSNVNIPQQNVLYTLASCLYYTLFYPAFYNAKNVLQLLASFENVMIAVCLLIIFAGLIKNRRNLFLPFVFLFFCISLCLLIGLTSPNSGAIFRYRSPAVIYLLFAALYYTDLSKFNWQIKRNR